MGCGGFSEARLRRMGEIMARHVEQGGIPGLVALLHRRGETHVEAHGVKTLGEAEPMTRDTIFRIASMTKPVTAVAAMILVEECVLRLDEPVDALLPELADRRVLRAARRAARRHRAGAAADHAARPADVPRGLRVRHGAAGPLPDPEGDGRSGSRAGPAGRRPLRPTSGCGASAALPLIHQPGERWLYHTASDVLGVLIARASGRRFEAFLRERIFEPLGMNDTGFSVPRGEARPAAERATRAIRRAARSRSSTARATAGWREPPAFSVGRRRAGLDRRRLPRVLPDAARTSGAHRRGRILSRPSVELMTTDQLTPSSGGRRASSSATTGAGASASAVVTGATDSRRPAGSAGTAATARRATRIRAEDLVGILLTQRLMDSPVPPRVYQDFWTSAYQAIDD